MAQYGVERLIRTRGPYLTRLEVSLPLYLEVYEQDNGVYNSLEDPLKCGRSWCHASRRRSTRFEFMHRAPNIESLSYTALFRKRGHRARHCSSFLLETSTVCTRSGAPHI